jgi:hypothetical protein
VLQEHNLGLRRYHPSLLCLSFRGRVLDNNILTLADYSILNENTLQLLPLSPITLNVNVYIGDGRGGIYATKVQAYPFRTVRDVKDMIESQEGNNPSFIGQRVHALIFANHQLPDNSMLVDTNITDGASLHCIFKRKSDDLKALKVRVDCFSPDNSKEKHEEDFELDASVTVDSLKVKIQHKVGVAADQQRLFYHGRLLQDGRTLAECGIPLNPSAYAVQRYCQLEMKPNWTPDPQMVVCYSLEMAKDFRHTKTASFELDASDTVDSLKVKIQHKVGVPADQQRLFYEGWLLQDGRTLAECGVNADAAGLRQRNVLMKPKHQVPRLDGEMKFLSHLQSRHESIFVELTDTALVVKAKLQVKTGLKISHIIFMGNSLKDGRTLAECGIEIDDTLIFVMELKGDIGVFVSALDSEQLPSGINLPAPCVLGAQWLMQPTLPSPLPPPNAVAELVRSFHPHTLARTAPRPPLSESLPAFSCVSETACLALRKRVDEAHSRAFLQHTQDLEDTQVLHAVNEVAVGVAAGSCETDFRLHLTLQELRSLVGEDSCARILSALETDAPDAIALRRTTASGRWINFHTDKAARTVQVTDCHNCVSCCVRSTTVM